MKGPTMHMDGVRADSREDDFYKRIMPSREARKLLLHALDWVPDRQMIALQYRIKRGFWPDLDHPMRFTEKLNWYKLNWHDPLMAVCVDKVYARQYVKLMGYEDILTPMLGAYDDPCEIDFDSLPDRFVLKDSLGSGNNDVIVCKDKAKLDWSETTKRMRTWVRLGAHRKSPGREWVYDTPRRSKILVEEILDPEDEKLGLVDYKYFCFGGKAPRYMYVTCDRRPGGGGQFGIFEVDGFRDTGVNRADERPLEWHIPQPKNYNRMVEIATDLASVFPHARIDLYDLGERGGVRFGEITFFDGSGYFSFDPDEFDFVLGEEFAIPIYDA
jgi:hypothetical protein